VTDGKAADRSQIDNSCGPVAACATHFMKAAGGLWHIVNLGELPCMPSMNTRSAHADMGGCQMIAYWSKSYFTATSKRGGTKSAYIATLNF
jgi:hypothetical protein